MKTPLIFHIQEPSRDPFYIFQTPTFIFSFKKLKKKITANGSGTD
jgi:hypothetical protein